jgi:hypothetical protein
MNEDIIALIKQNTPHAQIDPQPNTLIIGARSPETAVVVSDYPYGRRLRCVMRYWLETKKSHGTRIVSQTNNPKRPGLVWNKPHAGTYTLGAVVLHTDQNAHVKERAFTDFNLSTSTVERANDSLQQVENFERENAPAFTETYNEYIRRTKAIITTCLSRLQTPHQKTRLNTTCPVCKNYYTTCTGSEEPPPNTPLPSQTQLTTPNGFLF